MPVASTSPRLTVTGTRRYRILLSGASVASSRYAPILLAVNPAPQYRQSPSALLVIVANNDSIYARNWPSYTVILRFRRDNHVGTDPLHRAERILCLDSHTPRSVLWPGSVSTALPKLLDTLGASKALVVTGNSLYTKVCLTTLPPHCLSLPSFIPRRQML